MAFAERWWLHLDISDILRLQLNADEYNTLLNLNEGHHDKRTAGLAVDYQGCSVHLWAVRMHETFLGCAIYILTMAETLELARGLCATANGCSTWPSMSRSSLTCELSFPRLLVDHDEFKM